MTPEQIAKIAEGVADRIRQAHLPSQIAVTRLERDCCVRFMQEEMAANTNPLAKDVQISMSVRRHVLFHNVELVPGET